MTSGSPWLIKIKYQSIICAMLMKQLNTQSSVTALSTLMVKLIALVCLHADSFGQNRGQSLSNTITSFFGSFVCSHVLFCGVCVCVSSEIQLKQQFNFHDTSHLPSQMANHSKVVTVTLSCSQFPLNCMMKPVIYS